jgi:hypothetical protein
MSFLTGAFTPMIPRSIPPALGTLVPDWLPTPTGMKTVLIGSLVYFIFTFGIVVHFLHTRVVNDAATGFLIFLYSLLTITFLLLYYTYYQFFKLHRSSKRRSSKIQNYGGTSDDTTDPFFDG